ncbi:respiratory chain complex I subunit 1 family protein [Desulfocurvibacter africanus]|uniref:respiratory chain complex I subunit 1 family protein n=1 Tax=Desulfocurvibacter africanus TaxID=873 RepID=UPI0003F9534E|nr:complex I subunit 1 family protein [Desulfocurvibacter africanus]
MLAQYIMLVFVGLLIAPVAGGLIAGLDRRVTARVQSRFGPPLLQPFYDVAKLLGKESMIVNSWQVFCAYMYLLGAVLSVVLLFLQSDLLLLFFVQAIGALFLVFGAMSAPSPYSQVGAQRELMQILAYEPLLILVFVGIYLATGSFQISEILTHEQPLLFKLPLLFIVLGYALTIKLRKSPFDFSTSHHAHQELVKGVTTEFSGPYLAIIEVAHWYETVLVLGLVALFWSTSLWGMLALLLGTYFLEILIDNTMARLTWRWMLSYVWIVGLVLSVLNLSWLYAS